MTIVANNPAALAAARLVDAITRHPTTQRFAVMRTAGTERQAPRIQVYPCDEEPLPAYELLGVYDRNVPLYQIVGDLGRLRPQRAAVPDRRRPDVSDTLIDPFGRCEGALEVHASLPPGREILLPAAVPDPDEDVAATASASRRHHYRLAERAARLGMTQREFKAARAAGTLPAWCYDRLPKGMK